MTLGHNGGPQFRDAGWYATHRDMLNHPIVGIGKPVKPADPSRGSLSRFEAWHWLIANAAYKAKPINNTGKVMDLQPGQVMGARSYLAKEWNWSEMTVRWFLKTLLDEHMITLATDKLRNQQRTNTANIITLCNYLKYQLGEDEQNTLSNQQTTSKQPASNQPTTSQQPQSNKETNKQIIPPNERAEQWAGCDRGLAAWSKAIQVEGSHNSDAGFFRDSATGVLQLLNGARAEWLKRFEGDEQALELALIQAMPYVKPNNVHSIRVQVEAALAKQLSWKAEDAKARKSRSSSQSLRAKIKAAKEALASNGEG